MAPETTPSILYSQKTRIQDLTEVTSLNLKYEYLIDTSKVSSLQTPISAFAGKDDILNESAAKRYWTETNELEHTDLRLFSAYAQDKPTQDHKEKKVIFEKFPFVDNPATNTELSSTQLLTKGGVSEFQSYLGKKHLNAYSCIPAYNWENEYTIDDTTGLKVPYYTNISSFNDLLTKAAHDSRATYKFEYTTLSPNKNNVERTTNIVPLNAFKYNDSTITAIVHYTVAGFVAVKSDLQDQRSGTIYLEARKVGAKDDEEDGKWRTIDSAVFKFIPDTDTEKSGPGTYVTLTGYLSTEFETRLKLNLKSKGYSMNLYEFRDRNMALTNHYVNTFLGFVHIPDAVSKPANCIYFTNINYQSYFYEGRGISSYSYQYGNNETSKTFTTVDNLLSTAFDIDTAHARLEISSSEMKNPTNFKINGIRLSPIGEIYPLDAGPISIDAGTIIYPSYTSGTVEAIRPESHTTRVQNYPIAYKFGNNNFFDQVDYSQLKVLNNNTWNEYTEIFGKVSSEVSATHDTRGMRKVVGEIEYIDEDLPGELNFTGKIVAQDWATEKPRKQYSGREFVFDIMDYIDNSIKFVKDSLITCSVYLQPRTSGSGSGNESFGRVIDGEGHLLNGGTLKTKNVSKEFTKHLCTGSRWNYSAKDYELEWTQPATAHTFKLQAFADCGSGDGGNKTYFSVYGSNIKIKYKYVGEVPHVRDPYDAPSGDIKYYKANIEGDVPCQIADKSVYPIKINDVILYYDPPLPDEKIPAPPYDISALTNDTYFQNITATNMNYVPLEDESYTELTVRPYPENLVL